MGCETKFAGTYKVARDGCRSNESPGPCRHNFRKHPRAAPSYLEPCLSAGRIGRAFSHRNQVDVWMPPACFSSHFRDDGVVDLSGGRWNDDGVRDVKAWRFGHWLPANTKWASNASIWMRSLAPSTRRNSISPVLSMRLTLRRSSMVKSKMLRWICRMTSSPLRP